MEMLIDKNVSIDKNEFTVDYDIVKRRAVITDKNGERVFECNNPISIAQVSWYGEPRFMAVTRSPIDRTLGVLAPGIAIERVAEDPQTIDNQFWLFHTIPEENSTISGVMLYNCGDASIVSIPTFAGCSTEGIELKESNYVVDGIPCLEVTIPVKLSHIEDSVTYIFHKFWKPTKGLSNFHFVGAFSNELSSVMIPFNNLPSSDPSDNLKELIEREYIPEIQLRNSIVAGDTEKVKSALLAKKYGDRFRSTK